MKIAALRLFNVKRFAGRGVAIEGIGDGVNVLCAANEYGKSTSFEALHALFFQPHSSTAGDVRNLRPYSGGNPLVEADISTSDGSYRITKQFYGKGSARVVDLATGRVVAQADEAENFLADLVGGGMAGPAGLLWVRQGVTGIERRSKSEEEGEKQVRASLLESVQGEVEAVTGGRRMDEIMRAVQKRLEDTVTKRGAKVGSSYAAAIAERDCLETKELRLAGEVTALRAALDQRSGAMRELADLDRQEDRDARRKALEAAQAGLDAARAQSGALRAAQAELGLALERRDAAERELESFRAAGERARELGARLAEAGRRRTQALARRDEAAAAVAEARKRAEQADLRERAARKLIEQAQAALRAREAAERLEGLEKQLASAETTRRAIEEGEAALALAGLPDKAVAELDELEVELAGLKAASAASHATVAIAYEPGAPAVLLDGEPLKDGEPRGYERQAKLSVPGIGMLTLHVKKRGDDDGRFRDAQERRRKLLASMGAADLASVRKRVEQSRRTESDLRELKGRLSQLAPDGLPALREAVAARRAEAEGAIEVKFDPARVRGALVEAEERLRAARLAQREAEAAEGPVGDSLVAAEREFAALGVEFSQVEALLGPEAERQVRQSGLAENLAGCEAAHTRCEADVARLGGVAVDLQSAEATLQRTRSAAEEAERKIGELLVCKAALDAEIRTRSDEAVEESWREAADALAAARARVAAHEREVAVLQRLSLALDAARARARDTYLKPVLTELTPLLGLLFDDIAITFDEKTLLPQTILRNGQEEEVERLSGGMREQLSVLTRLAFARLLAKGGRPAPVILDDALIYSDDDRIEKMFDALHRQARDQQIIVFSCRQRAFQKLGGNTLRFSDWTP